LKAKKHFGQHFLTHKDTAKQIVDALGDISANKVLEIGPGKGILTEFLIQNSGQFKAIDIDPEAKEYLKTHLPLAEVILEDFLKANLKNIFDSPFSLIGNFPYNISSQIVFKIMEHHHLVNNWVGMFQLEMGERLLATPKDKKVYGILSVLLPFYYQLEKVMTLPPEAFSPPPKINSIVLKASRIIHPWKCDPDLLKVVVKTSFGQRRKTLSNSLSGLVSKEILLKHEYGLLRPENLSPLQFESLTAFIAENRVEH